VTVRKVFEMLCMVSMVVASLGVLVQLGVSR
jgi:hypothetical protein